MTIFNFDWTLFWETAEDMSWYEIAMLLCFGASWPFSIVKMLRSKTSEGKSYLFLILVMTGYLCGVGHKLFYGLDVVILLYLLLFLVVLCDMFICLHYRRRSLPKDREE